METGVPLIVVSLQLLQAVLLVFRASHMNFFSCTSVLKILTFCADKSVIALIALFFLSSCQSGFFFFLGVKVYGA